MADIFAVIMDSRTNGSSQVEPKEGPQICARLSTSDFRYNREKSSHQSIAAVRN
jgi:hypothetical protein